MNNKGFTLIELVVAMTIIAVLSTAGISNYISSLKKGRDAQRKSDLAQLQRSLEAFANDHKGIYPQSDQGKLLSCPYVTANPASSGACDWGVTDFRDTADVATTYMKKLIKDPSPGVEYYYVSDGGTSYQIYARLENTNDLCFTNNRETCILAGFSAPISCGVNKPCNYGVASTNTNP